ncbi:MAG: hypothetical protein WAK75_02400 [Methanoregula sp.]|uniref:hypothetical protein n=2 Tax=Methanoregula sp. TaxID=2052170 RepID=UPI003BAEDCF6
MRILRSVQSKVCVDGSLMKEFLIDEPLTPEFLDFLEGFGTVRSFSHLRHPYFSFEKERFISIKGFVGDTSVEVRYRKEFADLTADFFHLLLFYYREGPAGIATLKGIETSIGQKMDVRQGGGGAVHDRQESV